MFSFMKKDKEKKKDGKKPTKEPTAGAAGGTSQEKLTSDDLLRLDEVRRSLKIKSRRREKEKLPSGITADYTAHLGLNLATPSPSLEDRHAMQPPLASPLSDESETASLHSLSMKPETAGSALLPMPPARGILKGKSSYGLETSPVNKEALVDDNKLVENTLRNELIVYEKPPSVLVGSSSAQKKGPPTMAKRFLQQQSNGALTGNKEDTLGNVYSIPRPVKPLDPGAAAAIAAATGLVPAGESPSKMIWKDPYPAGEGCGWAEHAFRAINNADGRFNLPTLKDPILPEPRDITLQRREKTGDFGFSLRRSVVVDRSSDQPSRSRVVIFAEPVFTTHLNNKFAQLEPNSAAALLLPGDRLLEVNGRNVQDTSREDIIDIIRQSGTSVTLRVQPVAELVELSRRWNADGREIRLNDAIAKGGTLRRTGSLRHRADAKAKSDDELAREKAFIEANRVWLQHHDGFTAATLLPGEGDGDGKVRLQLDNPEKEIILADEEEVVKANPARFDQAEDLAHLRHLNEASMLHTLRCRYAASLPHTYAGPSLVVINPVSPLAVYSERMIQLFRGCKAEDMPPHIYASAQSAYRSMLASRSDQSMIFAGRSGSGKTHNFRHALHYLVQAAGCPSKILTVEKLNSICLLLEAFGNARTCLNSNATRFTNIFSLDCDQSGLIASASVQVLMPERERVTRRPNGEPTFHIFYELVAGATGELRRYLQLDGVPSASEPCAFMTPLQTAEDKEKAAVNFARVLAALGSLGVAETDSRCVWAVLAAIYHLGVAGAIRGPNNKVVFVRPAAAQRAATLLGRSSLEELAQLVFHASPTLQGSSALLMNGRPSFRTGSPVSGSKDLAQADKNLDPAESLEGFVQGLYVEAFNALVALINKSISSTAHTITSIVLVDTPGFQNPATTTEQQNDGPGATFQDLCHNYVQERLQLLFHDTHFSAQLNRYAQEHIEITLDGELNEDASSPEPLVDMLDRSPQSAVARASTTSLRDIDRRGFLWLLDEEALVSQSSSEEELLDKFATMYQDRVFEKLYTRGSEKNQLVIHHNQGTNSVVYNLDGWLKAARENPTTKNAAIALTESNKEDMASLFRSCRGPLPTTVSGSVAGIEGSQALRRASSIRRAFTSGTAGIKRKSLALQLKFQVDGLIETLRRTKSRFVYCFLPHHRAGLVDLSSNTFASNEESLHIPLLRAQLRGSELLPAIRLYRQGYPDYLPLGEFVRRFNVLVPPDALPMSLLTGLNSSTASEKQAAEILLLHIDLERTSYRLGLSQIFFRPGVLSQLEDQRDEKITARIVLFQAQCRGYLARKRMAKLKLQDTAIRCIQRNVRKYQAVKAWPWWRLMLRLSPLLNVHRTEEELKARTEEADNLRSRVAALEKERADLKYLADRLETKVSELTADLAEEHATSTLATERLEAESAQRMKLDKDFNDLVAKFRQLSGEHEKMEMEVLIARSAGLNGDGTSSKSDEEDDDGQPNIYRQKCERLSRELELTKHRLTQQHEDDLEQMVVLKKQLEKKLNDAYEEVEEQRQVVAQWKRKAGRLSDELNDTRLLHEEQTNRNALLEKKQRKFDSELQQLQEQLRQEKSLKERTMRERDAALSDKLSMEQTVQSVQLDLEMRNERLAALNKELEEMSTDGRSDVDLAALRRAKHDLELKVKDQEEELDELAGQVQMLESARLRLEMSMEQMRKEHKKELAQREEEMEDIRCSAQKKVKALESQLESEHEERTLLVREKHELERQLLSMAQHAAHAVDDDTIQKLKRDLKRTKALLRDAHAQLERSRQETPSKVLLRQLKNQLEDSEFARTAAVKGRQHAEQELLEAQQQLEEAMRLRSDAEDKYLSANRERSNYQSQVDDLEMELNDVMRKYKAAVAQLSVDQITLQDQTAQLVALEQEKSALKEQVAELSAKLECMEIDTKSVHTQKRMELKVKELESRVELEQTSKSRLETQISRLKEMLEKSNQELDALRCREQLSQESTKRLQRQLRDLREELTGAEQRDADTSSEVRELQQRIELLESENATLVKDLSLALRRIEDLQMAMHGEMDSSDDSDQHQSDSDSDNDSDSSFNRLLTQRRYGSTSGVSSAGTSVQMRRDSPVDSPSSSRAAMTPSPESTMKSSSFA